MSPSLATGPLPAAAPPRPLQPDIAANATLPPMNSRLFMIFLSFLFRPYLTCTSASSNTNFSRASSASLRQFTFSNTTLSA